VSLVCLQKGRYARYIGKGVLLVFNLTNEEATTPLIGVVLDACVIFPGSLRDTLLRLAAAKVYKLWLTDQILEEMRKNLVEKKHITEKQGEYLVNEIKGYFKSNFVTQHTILIPLMPVNEKDRHVLAAAVASDSRFIVTQNLKDFPPASLKQFEVEALSPDEFLTRQFSQNPEAIIPIIQEQVGGLKKHPITMQDLLEKKLGKFVPNFVRLVQDKIDR
jgi:predicted nucleic acid-binding protein